MKKVLLTLARWFHVDLTEVKYVEREKVVEVSTVEYKERFVALEGTVDGDLMVKGNLVVNGKLEVMGGICSCLGVCDGEELAHKRDSKEHLLKED